MDTIEAIKSRRSIRLYRSEAVPDDKVEQILEAGRWAPSADNSQPWAFVVIRDEKVRKDLADAAVWGRFLAQAPVAIAVVIDPQVSGHAVEDGAAATQNMLLAAHALGLGSCWVGAYGSTYEERVKDLLGIPSGKRLLSLISLGYARESTVSTRKSLGEIVFRNKYGEK